MTARTLRTVEDLAGASHIPRENIEPLERVAARYALAITPAMAALIDRRDPGDPIARQFVPDLRELDRRPEENADPIGDKRHSPVEGVVHRYRDRVLLKIVHICPVYCRFCFRREMVGPGGEPTLSPQALDSAIAYIASHGEITEVILTGGDPFILTARRAAELTQRLAAIAHVKILRWHTRVPVVEPEHVTDDFVAALRAPGKATYVALHANHPREFTQAARAACARLVDAGIPMLSQSVLLKGVNDDADTLAELMRAFVENRIKPYYLHHADLAPGTAHFRTTIAHGQNLLRDLRRRVSGLAVPRYVLDIPGGHAKANLETCDIEQTPTGIKVRDDEGRWHDYPPEKNED
jgi:lysine 2,3-aminomutase